jgi:hypothetical protein
MAAAPKLPASIRVGHRDISVNLATTDNLEGANGDYLADKQRIRLGDWLMPQSMAEVLIHEVLHACWPNRWTLVGDVEETFVSALAPSLAGVMRDNPSLVLWLSHALS